MRTHLIIGLALIVLSGCQDVKNPESDNETVVSSAAFNAAGAPIVEFKVPDMMCEESCAKAVHDTLAAQPGAVEVQVDFPNRLATVAVDEQTFDPQAALDALFDKQFSEAKLVGTENSDSATDGKL